MANLILKLSFWSPRYNHQKIVYLINILNTMTLILGIIVSEYK